MEIVTARQSWSDDRIDGLERKVDEGFRHVDRSFAQVDRRLERVEDELGELRGEMSARFDSMQRGMLVFGTTMFAALLGAFATQFVLILTHG